MTKKEAAELLGVSERAIERYTAKGLLAPRYERREGQGQRLAAFDPKQVRLLKRQMENGTRAALARPDSSARPATSRHVALSPPGGAPAAEQFIAAIAGLARSAALPLDRKLGLGIAEAAELTGLPARFIRRAIKAKRLKATRPGRAWHIKRRDLDQWYARL
ncbi:MAG TPA: helix-turn-helix domain-containing protein [Blastocatellia bacterium]|nr:helix-turn-helix domain-containing protein [Blastocatellia bacterium]